MAHGEWYCPPRPRARGPHPQPRRRPRPDLRYAQVVEQRTGGRITAIHTQVVFGDPAAGAARLAQSPVSRRINTRFVERDNLTQRQQNRRLTRRTNGFSKDLTWFETPMWLSLACHHLILPHASVRTPYRIPNPRRAPIRPAAGVL